MTENRNEKRDARKITKALDIQYTRALRWLRAGRYVVNDGQVEKGPNYDE